jgi:phosphoribosylaminoimidazolecarboxamide formyltransferase/IMP cyclohydrolase
MPQVKRALISVFDKSGIVGFASGLKDLGVEIISTGGTAKMLKGAGISIRSVSDYTGFPEILEGRVKTLHPKVHGALLALRDNPQHMKEVKEHNIELIDMVVINLYPFEATIAREGVTNEEAIENIDIGGPTMLRSAAKNYKWVVPISDPKHYNLVLEEMRKNQGWVSEETCLKLATDVFRHLSKYNYHIYRYFLSSQPSPSLFPDLFQILMEKVMDLRYGENPHQTAAFYREVEKGKAEGVAGIEQLGGKELSFNNIIDLDSAINIVREFEQPVAVIIKHNNPCGVATGETLLRAYQKAYECDPLSAFGSIVGFNRKVDIMTAEEIGKTFVEAVVAPDFAEEAVKVLKVKKDIRLLKLPEGKLSPQELDYRRVSGGMLVQTKDLKLFANDGLEVVTQREPTEVEWKALNFSWKVCKHVKSNAIVLAGEDRTIGIGAGQMSRVDAVKIAVRKMEEQWGRKYKGVMVLASDAFFPFRDSVDLANASGVTAIIQPGGSLRDKESITACNEYKMAMVFTGMRHFRH